MSFTRWLRNLRSVTAPGGVKRKPRLKKYGPQLLLEPLEERLVPTIVFDPVFQKETSVGTAPFTVLNSPKVDLIFWGPGWASGQVPGKSAVTTLTNAAQALLKSTFFGALNEYGNVGTPVFGAAWTDVANPLPAGYTSGAQNPAIQGEVANAIGANPTWAPSGPSITQSPIYVVIPVGLSGGYNIQSTYSSDAINICSVTGGGGAASAFTQILSHELAEDITDPTDSTTGATFAFPTASSFPGYINETPPAGVNNNPSLTGNIGYLANSGVVQIGDGEQEPGGQSHYAYQLNGVPVQSLWSASTLDKNGSAGAFIVTDGNSDTVYLDPVWTNTILPNPANGFATNPPITGPAFTNQFDLTVRGNQISVSATDSLVTVTVDGAQTFTFSTAAGVGQIRNITLEPSGANAEVDLTSLAADQTANIHGGGTDIVNLGNANVSVQGIQGTVNIDNPPSFTNIGGIAEIPNPPSFTTINIDDSANNGAYTTAHMGTIPGGWQAGWGYITGLGQAGNINYVYTETSSVTITTGAAAGNAFGVWENGVPTYLNLHGSTTVGIGDGLVGVQSILGTLNIQNTRSFTFVPGVGLIPNPPPSTTINIDDSADHAVYTGAHMGTIPGGWQAGWGYITGLAPADINYTYPFTSSLTIATSTADGDVFGVWENGVPTTLIGHGQATVNIGDGLVGVQSILGTLNIETTRSFTFVPGVGLIPNPPSFTTIYVNDGPDGDPRVATLGTFIPAGDTPWGYITGLSASADINYKYDDTRSLTIDGSSGDRGGNGFRVLENGVPTYLIGHGPGAVSIGDGLAGVQGIRGTLNIENDDVSAINIDDGADGQSRVATLGTFTPYADTPWGYITGLSASANINYEYDDATSLSINGSSGGNVFNVETIGAGVPVTITTATGSNTINLSPAAENLDNLRDALTVNGNATSQLIVNDQKNSNFLGAQYTLTGNTLTRASEEVFGLYQYPSITFSGLGGLELDTGTFSSQVNVQSPAAPTTVNASLGYVLFDVSSLANDLTVLMNPAQPALLTTLVNALNNLQAPTQPVVVTLDGQGGAYGEQRVALPNNVKLQFTHCVFPKGGSPTLTVLAGQVSVLNSTLANATDAPTILVSGGSLTLRNDVIQESTGYNQAAVRVTGGSADLGTAADPGGNTLNVNGSGTWIDNTGPNSLSALGDVFEIDGVPVGGQLTLQAGGPTVTLSFDGKYETVTGLSSVPFQYVPGTLSQLTIDGRSGGNVFDVEGIGAGTAVTIATGSGGSTVTVSPATQNLDNIASALTVNGNGADALIVNDQATATNQAYTVTANTLTRAPVAFPEAVSTMITYTGLGSLVLYAGNVGTTQSNVMTVHGTAAGTPVNLHEGAGYYSNVYVQANSSPLDVDMNGGHGNVELGRNGIMAGIQALVNVHDSKGTGDSISIFAEDGSDPTPRVVTVDDGTLTGLSAGPIHWTTAPNGSYRGGVQVLYITGGSGGNTFNVNNTSNFYDFTWIAAGNGGLNKVNIRATTGTLYVQSAYGGQNVVTAGSLAPALGGTLANIKGSVYILDQTQTALTPG